MLPGIILTVRFRRSRRAFFICHRQPMLSDHRLRPISPRSSSMPAVDPISATTLSHYVRLERCQRYLRLSLHSDEMRALTTRHRDLGIERPPLAPTLRASGRYWEEAVVASLPTGMHNLQDADAGAT